MKNIFILLLAILIVSSCTKEQETLSFDTNVDESLVEVKLVNDKLKFADKESLTLFMEQNDQSEIKKKVSKFTEQGFKTLRPFFEDNEEEAMNDFLVRKQAKIAKKGYLYSSKSNDDEIDLDDELISDANFAAILNEDRAIYVGDSLYIYTTLGAYACKIEDEEHLRNYLSNESSKISSKEKLLAARGSCNYYISSYSRDMLEPIELRKVPINSKINRYESCGGGSGGGSGSGSGSGSGGSSSTSLQASMPIITPMSFGTCKYSENSIWQSIFGNRVKCNDYHDSTHRVQTQFYNENYLLFNKIGMKVKYQKKRFIGCSQSGTADYVEMGINSLMFNYKNPYTLHNPFSTHHIKYKYKGVTYDMQGRVIQDSMIEPAWPISNESQILIPLVIEIK